MSYREKESVMKMFRKFLGIGLAVLSLGFCAFPAFGEQWSTVIRPEVNAGTGTADYSLDMFAPVWQDSSSLIFFDPRFRINPALNNENEVNLGLGYRRLIMNDAWFVGGNVFFDTTDSANNHRYNQVGVGLEARSKWIDAILNGYIVTGNSVNRLTGLDRYSLGEDALLRRNGYEEAMSGMDGEVGTAIPGISNYIETRAYVGGYWWSSKEAGDITGVRARVQVDPVPLVTLNGIYSWDHVNQSDWRGEAYLNIPFSVDNLVKGKNPFAGLKDALAFGKGVRTASERMTDRVERDRDVETRTGTASDYTNDHGMIYVNNAYTGTVQNGTLSHPYTTLAQAGNDVNGRTSGGTTGTVDIPYIYVFHGNNTYTDGLSLANGSSYLQSYMVWGQGYALPGMTAGTDPFLTTNGIFFNGGSGAGGNITVRGMNVTGASGDGLYATGVRTADIYDNNFSNNGGDGIDIYNAPLLMLGSNGGNGIGVVAPSGGSITGDMNINITGNTANSNSGDNIYVYAVNNAAGDGSTNVNISGNQASGSKNSDGIDAEAYNYVGGAGNTTLNVANNTANGNAYDNIYAETENEAVGGGNTTVNVTGNYASGSLNNRGIEAYAYNYAGGAGNTTLNVANNTANDNAYGNIYAYAENDALGGGNTAVNVTGNQASGSTGGDGIDAEAYNNYNGYATSGSGDVALNVSGNTANNNYDDNIYAYAENEAYSGGNTALNVTGNQASGSTDDYGIDAEAYSYVGGAGNTTLNVANNTANGNYYDNIYAEAENEASGGGNTALNVTGNQASNQPDFMGYGIDAEAYNYVGGSGDVSLNVANNTANNDTGGGIYAYAENEAYSGGNTALNVTGNQASGSSQYSGIDAEAYSYVGGAGNTTLNVANNTANGNYYDNIYAEAENEASGGGSTTVNISGNQASGSLNSFGIDAYAEEYSTGAASLTMDSNTASNNYYNGLYADVLNEYGGGPASLEMSGNTALTNSSGDFDMNVQNFGLAAGDTVSVTGSGNVIDAGSWSKFFTTANGSTPTDTLTPTLP